MSSHERDPLSPHGDWFWDGSRWQRVPPRPDQRTTDRWLTGAAIAAFLLLAVPVSLSGWALAGGHSITDLNALGRAVSGCDSSALLPNANLVAGGKFCGGLRVGKQILSVDCHSRTSVDQNLVFGALDSSGNPGGKGSVALANGSCVMTAPTGEAVGAEAQQLQPGDGVVVADFTPPLDMNTNIVLDLRCSQSACISVLLAMDGTYKVAELSDAVGGVRQLAGTQAVTARLRLGRPNRLIASFKGSNLSIFLNGGAIFSGTTAVPTAGSVLFLTRNVGQKSSVVKLGSIKIYTAG